MTVYRRGGVYWMDFRYRGRRVQRSTGQITEDAALAVERKTQDELRQHAHGVAIAQTPESPSFADWAEIYFEHVQASPKISRPERIEDLIRSALRFWGRRPRDPKKVHEDAPYHDLRLSDPVEDPRWVLKWETWLSAPRAHRGAHRPRTWSGQTKNQHRSVVSQMFKVAMSPTWTKTTNVTINPFVAVERDPRQSRDVALEVDDVTAVLEQSSYHLRLAMAIALLTPKLREGNILKLRWTDFTKDFQWLTVSQHKTRHRTQRPLVAYVPEQLREILVEAKRRAGRSPFVITYQGQPVGELRGAVRGAVARAGKGRPALKYGRDVAGGLTFHTLRHSAATLLAELKVQPALHQAVMGHTRLETTLNYTHLRPTLEAEPAEQLSAILPIKALVLASRRRPPAVGTTVTDRRQKPAKTLDHGRPQSQRTKRRAGR